MTARMILASRSAARATMLADAGVPFEIVPAAVDEAAIKATLVAEGARGVDIAAALAEMKARRVAARRRDCIVLGADQVLVLRDRLLDKPVDRADAATRLRLLRGATHELYSAAVAYEDGVPVWRHVGRARLTMRPFTDAFLESYLDRQGDGILDTVGAYRLEAEGAQLFSRVEGDFFTVLGLPLLELLGFLRTRRVVLE